MSASPQAAEQQQLERRLAAMAREVTALTQVKEMLGRERESLKRQSSSLHDWLAKPVVRPPALAGGAQQQAARPSIARREELP